MPTHEEVLNEIAARNTARYQEIEDNLPSWSQVETALDNISNLTEAKAALKKIARVVYYLAKNKAD
jgi:penicillin V acylase-like amidase (Ntn superfamily)